MEQRIQSYLDGEIVRLRTGVHSYEVRTSHGTGKGSTVAEALKDLADKQVQIKSKAESTSLNIQAKDVKTKKKRKSKKKVEAETAEDTIEAES